MSEPPQRMDPRVIWHELMQLGYVLCAWDDRTLSVFWDPPPAIRAIVDANGEELWGVIRAERARTVEAFERGLDRVQHTPLAPHQYPSYVYSMVSVDNAFAELVILADRVSTFRLRELMQPYEYIGHA